MVRDFFLGFIKIHVLHHAAEGEVYGLALISELHRHGYHLSPGSMYPVLHGLEKAGYVRRVDRLVNGKVRKYYATTRRGAKALTDARRKISELVGEVLMSHVIEEGAKHISARRSAKSRQGPERSRQTARRVGGGR
jgi:DNA-binding PadR family transcriptional regulator